MLDLLPVITPHDLATIGLLIFLEGILSIDNALALAMIARKLPKERQKQALTYGLVGAIVFRIAALGMAGFLMKWVWIKWAGGIYLIWLAASHWFVQKKSEEVKTEKSAASFWKTIILIELTDIAFAVDSILAAVAVSDKLWVVVTGGLIGLIMMRFAAHFFIELLNRFPNFEETAYILVFVVGVKLLVTAMNVEGIDFHSPSNPGFIAFWILVLGSVGYGFMPRKKKTIKKDLAALKVEDEAADRIDRGGN